MNFPCLADTGNNQINLTALCSNRQGVFLPDVNICSREEIWKENRIPENSTDHHADYCFL